MSVTFTSFLHETGFSDLPDEVVAFARRCLLDLLGVAVSGSRTELSGIIRNHAASHFGAGSSSAALIFDGRRVSPAGAALANGMTIDSLDAHDGHKMTKGHVGCHVLPALLALAEAEDKPDAADFLSSLIVGYEIGTRAGIALHHSAPDYHTSGAWGAVVCAGLGARVLGLSSQQTREAIGIGEYHGPRSQMMRCIDHPTMLKDGSGWGAMTGVSAAYLAREGFTGAPALTVEGEDVAEHWHDLGSRWMILEQYFKLHPVCRWSQPAVEAVLVLMAHHRVTANDINHVEVTTFHQGCRLAVRRPQTTEQAQYSLPFPVAAAAVRGKLGPAEVSPNALQDPDILRLSDTMVLVEDPGYSAAFPAQRYAHVALLLNDGTRLQSQRYSARGDPEDHLPDAEIRRKFHDYTDNVIGQDRATEIERAVDGLGQGVQLGDLLSHIVNGVGVEN